MFLETRREVAAQLGIVWQDGAPLMSSTTQPSPGEQPFYTFIASGTLLSDERARWQVVFRHLTLASFIMALFVANLRAALRLIYARPHMLSTRCCLVQAAVGFALSLVAISVIFPEGPSCRTILLATTASIRIGDICISTVLLQRAYIAQNRSRWLLVFVPVIVAAPVYMIYATWASPPVLTIQTSGCVFIYSDYYPWIRFAFQAPMNVVLTAIFIKVAYRRYARLGSMAWGRLVREGIQTGLLLLLISLLCTFAVAFEFFGIYSIVLTVFEWSISSMLLVMHVENTQRALQPAYEQRQIECRLL
ncbi:hypothetical protein THASP1DRAFT_29766 [Thamnocephalis sphaerospora]|uniref:Uncharacterized protein n=1 Tax=Thamnocephalis sphaerospora TaxID=78915 RepID=A0A4P9XQV0_9FUNG|nr:hypothetical protein THASP1DRAFT_29766 [Thamnocephalis sphaerospora]|eukprot:RKP08426.1 hypothetical protein THASP1DRAFT_29766 [Thamnocephalis sphaerospora]